MEVAAALNGTPVYGLRINSKLGTVNLSKTSPKDVSVVLTDPGQKVWFAGNGSSATGTVTSNPDASGSIDTDLAPLQGSADSVHIKGSWTCP